MVIKMNRLLLLPVLLLTLVVGKPAFSADFQKGVSAYEKGDFATALRQWTPLAEQGYAYAQHNIGVMYDKGQGVAQDHKVSIKWYKLAAVPGDATAQYNHGNLSAAQYNLGNMYRKGEGVPQNHETSFKWYKLAAEQGHTTAQYNLGVMFNNGTGTFHDYTFAHMWMNIAVLQGYEDVGNKIDLVEKNMTPTQLGTAQRLTRECVAKNYKGC